MWENRKFTEYSAACRSRKPLGRPVPSCKLLGLEELRGACWRSIGLRYIAQTCPAPASADAASDEKRRHFRLVRKCARTHTETLCEQRALELEDPDNRLTRAIYEFNTSIYWRLIPKLRRFFRMQFIIFLVSGRPHLQLCHAFAGHH